MTLIVGFGQRLLTALDRNHLAIGLIGLQSPIVVLCVLGLIALGGVAGDYVAVAAYGATFVLSVVSCVVAARLIRPAVSIAVHDAPRLRSVRGARVFDVAWPMLVQMIALPLAMQTDRIVLSHVASVTDLAQYNLASQVFTPVWSVVNSAGAALWPLFARARARADHGDQSVSSLAVGFGAGAGAVSIVLAVCSPWLASVASGGTIRLPVGLVVAFTVFMALQGVKYPLGMYMTDARGLRYQALMILLLLPVNLGLSVWLAYRWGAAGPVVGSAVSVFLCQVLANWWYVRREVRRRTASAAVEAGGRHRAREASG